MIAIAPSHKNQLSNYTNWLTKRGFQFKILKESDNLSGCSMLMLCGGPDIKKESSRDELETRWFKQAYGKIPVIGICRGLQLSNVLLGGTLHDDLSEELVKHTSNKKSIAGEPQPLLESSWHNVILKDDTQIRVNSRHHQGIDKLAPGLNVVAVCDKDRLPEMVEGDNALFIQWHPEREDVWGTDAEKIVYEWVKSHYTEISPISKITSYMKSKGFSVISNERVRKSIDPTLSDGRIYKLIRENSNLFKQVKDRENKTAIKILK